MVSKPGQYDMELLSRADKLNLAARGLMLCFATGHSGQNIAVDPETKEETYICGMCGEIYKCQKL